MCQLTQQERFYDDYDPQVDLEVKGFMIPQGPGSRGRLWISSPYSPKRSLDQDG
jgi:hypothetical protein